MIWLTSDANSEASPSRFGNCVISTSGSRTFGGAAASIGVLKMPGAMVHTRIPYRARSRAIGNVMPTTPPFDAL